MRRVDEFHLFGNRSLLPPLRFARSIGLSSRPGPALATASLPSAASRPYSTPPARAAFSLKRAALHAVAGQLAVEADAGADGARHAGEAGGGVHHVEVLDRRAGR